MIVFESRFGYFLSEYLAYATDTSDLYKITQEWKRKYNCRNTGKYGIYTCSEEDFLIIQLACPEAISHVISTL
jgi:hypothetical protein